jgi:hypothetical protein
VGAEHRPYLAALRHKDPDEIASELEAITQLRDSPGRALIAALIDDVHTNAVHRLLFASSGAEGRVMEQAEYARLLGFLAGLDQFRVAIEAYELHAERVRNREDTEP